MPSDRKVRWKTLGQAMVRVRVELRPCAELSDQSLLGFGPLTDVLRSVVSDDVQGMLAAAPAAMTTLGLSPERLMGPGQVEQKPELG